MMNAGPILAKKYATAFLNVFERDVSLQDISHVCAAGDFLTRNRTLLYFLAWPALSVDVKIKALQDVLEKFRLAYSFEKLVALLAADRRLHIIDAVFSHICLLYMTRKKIANVAITSSHQLSPADIETIEQFLVNITGLSIIYDYKIDKNLIAGIRLQSGTFLWQYSVRKQLDQMKLQLIR